MEKIDRIAMIVAAVLVVGSILFAFFIEDRGAVLSDEIQTNREKINAMRDEQQMPQLVVPDLREQVAARYTGLPDRSPPSWIFYRRPAVAILRQPAIVALPVHLAGKVAKLSIERSKELRRPRILVDGKLPVVKNAKLVNVILERLSAGTEGWAKVADLQGAERFEVLDSNNLVAGQKYTYRVRSQATPLGTTSFVDPQQPEATSAELGPIVLPYDVSYTTHGPQLKKPNAAGNQIIPGSVRIEKEYYDYEKGELKKIRAAKAISEVLPGTKPGPENMVDEDYFVKSVELVDKRYRIQLKSIDGSKPDLELWDKDPPRPTSSPAVESPAEALTESAPEVKPMETAPLPPPTKPSNPFGTPKTDPPKKG